MANILLLDDSPVAQRALAGILGRGDHRFAAVDTIAEAWKFLIRNVAVDLLILELKMRDSAASPTLGLIRLLRSHGLFKTLPILVYTTVTDRETVRQALALRVQNYLVKPYNDEKIFAEVAKAISTSWRAGHFEEERSFCAQMNVMPSELRTLVERVRTHLLQVSPDLKDIPELGSLDVCAERLSDLREAAENAGCWGIFDMVNELVKAAGSKNWTQVQSCTSALTASNELILHHLHPDRIPPDYISEEEQEAIEVKQRRELWLAPGIASRVPLASWDHVRNELDQLKAFPVVQNQAAAFELTADGRELSVAPLADLASKDPGLAAFVLQAANALKRGQGEDEEVGDPAQAVQLLGGSRLRTLAQSIPGIEEHAFREPPLSWKGFWMYQSGCSRLCAYICDFMEIPIFMPQAVWAGLLHDIGKMLMVRIYPESLKAGIRLAAERSCSLNEALQQLIGCTTGQIGAHMAHRHGFPSWLVEVIRFTGEPEQASDHQELAALVTFASHLCRRYNIGYNGEPAPDKDQPLNELPGWQILRERVFPSFDLLRFDVALQHWLAELRAQLEGRSIIGID